MKAIPGKRRGWGGKSLSRGDFSMCKTFRGYTKLTCYNWILFQQNFKRKKVSIPKEVAEMIIFPHP